MIECSLLPHSYMLDISGQLFLPGQSGEYIILMKSLFCKIDKH